ncbi:hypothetical protein OPV22_018954 [Ensete ventricosum]|uniref:Uncharacterized protein n=1 Tax=Ensete ventricosum TaxID=4639 RepID=A0AAV8R1D7_ENSVE|nr:hypothetical protein OPV22_018954 [Ensete ventricosum]
MSRGPLSASRRFIRMRLNPDASDRRNRLKKPTPRGKGFGTPTPPPIYLPNPRLSSRQFLRAQIVDLAVDRIRVI